MPDTRTHRGPHPEDEDSFSAAALPGLRNATDDLCWLLSRGYAPASAVKLVGDRYALVNRQRIAVSRAACSDEARGIRTAHQLASGELRGEELWIDGYNALTTVEAALSGGVILHARDGCFRDMASMHGSYRKVAETVPAIELIGKSLAQFGVARCRWFLDRPVSNSGRLKTSLAEVADKGGWNWEIELVQNPDNVLAETDYVVASADSVILDRCRRWFNLARFVVEPLRDAWVVDLSGASARECCV